MAEGQVPVDDPEAVRRILENTEALLLDFDGPICAVFAGVPAHHVASQLRSILAERGHIEFPKHVEETGDPFDVFRYAAELGESEAQHVESALRRHEVEAVAGADPIPGAHELIRRWGRWLSIVSNNSTAAIETYLKIHDLSWHVDDISGRTTHDPSQLMPSRTLLDKALYDSFIRSSACTFVSDTESDIATAQAAGCMTIGYANEPEKLDSLARADLLVRDMSLLRPPPRESPRP